MKFNTIEEAILDIKAGKIVVIVDDFDEDNTGDLVLAADKANQDALDFICQNTQGAITLTAPKETYDALGIHAVYEQSIYAYQTAQALSIDLIKHQEKNNFNRLETIQAILNGKSKPEDFKTPGSIFPILYRKGGVLKRAGRPESSVDLAKLANLSPIGVNALIIKENNEPARLDELLDFAKKHHLKIITVTSLIAFRKQSESLVKRAAQANLPTSHGEFKMVGFENAINGEHHVALVKGDINPEDEVLVRVHSECLTGDAFGSMKCDCGEQLQAALDKIEAAGKGVLVYMRQEGRGIGLINKIRAYDLQDKGMDTVEANLALGFAEDLRDYGIGAQILSDLGVKKVKLMTNNPLKLVGLSGYGIDVVGREPIQLNHNEKNELYMRTKKEKMGHLLKFRSE